MGVGLLSSPEVRVRLLEQVNRDISQEIIKAICYYGFEFDENIGNLINAIIKNESYVEIIFKHISMFIEKNEGLFEIPAFETLPVIKEIMFNFTADKLIEEPALGKNKNSHIILFHFNDKKYVYFLSDLKGDIFHAKIWPYKDVEFKKNMLNFNLENGDHLFIDYTKNETPWYLQNILSMRKQN